MKLSQQQIAMAALDLVTESGAERLTMQRLADRLGVRPSSLYNHISGKTEVIELIRDQIVQKIDVTTFLDQPWQVAMATWCRSYLSAFAAYPGVIRLLATTPISSTYALSMYEIVMTGLHRGGWAPSQLLAVMRTTEAFILGSALDYLAPATLLTAEVVPPQLQILREALSPRHLSAGSAVKAFELGLAAFIAGLEAHLDRTRTSPAAEGS